MKILIVEDEILILKSLTKLLEKQGVDVTATPSGRNAIELLKNNSFDRVITDLMLQDISGFDILEEAKQYYSKHEIEQRFIIITAYSSPQVLAKAEEYRCRVINKPFTEIHKTIQEFIR